MDIVQKESTDLEVRARVDAIVEKILEFPQADNPIFHRFGPGLYIREAHISAGVFAIGHKQRFEHLNVMLQGKGKMYNPENGLWTEFIAPMMFVGKPGQKMFLAEEYTVWQNIYATTETDIGILEDTYLDKAQVWKDHEKALFEAEIPKHEEDRVDYLKAIQELGFTQELVKACSEFTGDRIDIRLESMKFRIDQSPIEGVGIFCTAPISEGEIIGPARVGEKRTQLGRYTNHSLNPNAIAVDTGDGILYMVAARPIRGSQGGSVGEEITIDYRQSRKVALDSERS